MLLNNDSNEKYGQTINVLVGAVGIILILLGIVIKCTTVVSTILLSIGTSMLATAIVTKINTSYAMKTRRMEQLLSTWKLHNMYETKADMNTFDANKALEQCNDSIDIIAEGLSNYLAAQGTTLKNKILHNGLKVRIISCDSSDMLRLRNYDESGDYSGGDAAVQKVKKLDQWVADLRKELGINKDNIEIRYHNTYPGFSYLKIDSMLFVSTNLWRKPSQQSFALSFTEDGKGGKYFQEYFQDLWDNFVHEGCELDE